MASGKWSVTTLAGATVAAFLASACCIGPLVLAALGIGGAALLVKLEPYRPVLTAATLAFLAAGFYFTYRKPATSAPGDACGCPPPRGKRLAKVLLWVATILVVGFWSFPYFAERFLG